MRQASQPTRGCVISMAGARSAVARIRRSSPAAPPEVAFQPTHRKPFGSSATLAGTPRRFLAHQPLVSPDQTSEAESPEAPPAPPPVTTDLREVRRRDFVAQALQHCTTSQQRYTWRIFELAIEDKPQQVAHLLLEMNQRAITIPAIVYWIIVPMYARLKDLGRTLRSVEQMERAGMKRDVETSISILMAYVNAGQLEQAEEAFAEIKKNGLLSGRAYSVLVSAFAQLGQEKKARAWFEEMGKYEPLTSKHLQASTMQMAKLYAKLKWFLAAEQLLAGEHKRGAPPHGPAYSLLISGLLSHGQPAEAERVLRSLEPLAVPELPALYASVLDHYFFHHHYLDAELLLGGLRPRGLTHNAEISSVLLKALTRAGKVERALDLLAEMHRSGFRPPVIAYSSLIDRFAAGGNFRSAERVLRMMEEVGERPTAACYFALLRYVFNEPGLQHSVAEKWTAEVGRSNAIDKPLCTLFAQTWARIGERSRSLHWMTKADSFHSQ